MIEARIGESGCVVAIFAAVARLRVIGCLAHGFLTVVTCHTSFGDAAMVEPAYRPFICRVAGVAFTRGCNMIGVLACRPDVVVAARASFRRTFKYAALVARFTGNLRMPTR